MNFSYNWLQSFFYLVKSSKAGAKQFNRVKKKLPKPERLAELLTMHSFEVSEVKKVGKDWILDIDVLPNRAPDCFSHLGIAREIGAIIPIKYREPFSFIKEDKNLKTKNFVSVTVKDKMACPRYTARVITDVQVGPSPKWLQERLKVCGLRPINNIVDIANYVMLETGQPLHAFDGEKLKERKIIVRFAKKREKIVTLDEEKYDLDEDILVIADAQKPAGIAGIKGEKTSAIDKKTKTVVLESANFNPRVIRQGSKKLNLKTDASLRFEHGIDPNLTETAINRAAYLIQNLAGGKITQGLIDFYPQKVLPKRIRLDLDYVESLLGVKIPVKEIKSILKRLNLKIDGVGPRQPRQWWVEVPTFRLDLSIPEDLIEEIGRIYGYQKIPSTFPMTTLVPAQRNLEIFWENIVKNILKEAGFSEIYNYSFISKKEAEIFDFPGQIEVENPISLDFKYLRPSLIPNLLKNIKKNQANFEEIKIFELGKIFKKFKMQNTKIKMKIQSSKILEKRMFAGVMTGDVFYEAKGVVDLLFNKLGIGGIWYDEYQPTPEESRMAIWYPKKSAEIKVNSEEIGFLGEISPKILEKLKIEKKVTVFDLDFEKLSKLASEETIYRPISPYPAAIRDIAILVPREVRFEEVLNKIEIAGGKLVKDVDLFDIYEGEEIPEGKKSLAFRIIYQSEERTLTSREIDEIQQKIIKTLEGEPEWQVRK